MISGCLLGKNEMSHSINAYINSLFRYDKYCFSQFSSPTILSTDFAIQASYLNKIIIKTKQKKDISKYLLSNHDKNGYFIDKEFNINNNSYHKNDYIFPQFTYFTLIALDILGINNLETPFIENYLNEVNLKKWFQSLDWGNFWYESNKIMFMLFFFSYLERYNKKLRNKARQCIQLSFQILNEKQDKNTGFWGTNYNNNNLMDGCAGSAHIYIFYDYFHKEIKHAEKIIDSTLLLHKYKLINGKGGGACEDYDAIECYFRCLRQTDYKKNEIIRKLSKMRAIISRSQNRNGGYPYKCPYLFCNYNDVYKYSSWDKMTTPIYKPDIWGTFFRDISIKVIDYIIDNKKDFQSYQLPGWGYITND